MLGDVNQSKSTVYGDQVGGDKNVTYQTVEVKKELAPAMSIIENANVTLDDFVDIDADDNNTVLIKKLKDGGFNSIARNNAKIQKLRTVSTIFSIVKNENGKKILTDIYCNLISVINTKYIVFLNDGESLRTSFREILNDLSDVVNKYKDLIAIDEAFLEGLLYVATSNCALRWLLEEESNENPDDSK